MSADYFNSSLVPMSYSGTTKKWYEVARSRENRLYKKIDVFMYLSMIHDDSFELLYVSLDEINRRVTRSYHGRFVIKKRNNYLIIRHGLCHRKLRIVSYDEKAGLVALSNRNQSKMWILSSSLPVDKDAYENMMGEISKAGYDVSDIELFYD